MFDRMDTDYDGRVDIEEWMRYWNHRWAMGSVERDRVLQTLEQLKWSLVYAATPAEYRSISKVWSKAQMQPNKDIVDIPAYGPFSHPYTSVVFTGDLSSVID